VLIKGCNFNKNCLESAAVQGSTVDEHWYRDWKGVVSGEVQERLKSIACSFTALYLNLIYCRHRPLVDKDILY